VRQPGGTSDGATSLRRVWVGYAMLCGASDWRREAGGDW